MDEELRNLERLANQGDEQAQAKLEREQERIRERTKEEMLEAMLDDMLDESPRQDITAGKYFITVRNTEIMKKELIKYAEKRNRTPESIPETRDAAESYRRRVNMDAYLNRCREARKIGRPAPYPSFDPEDFDPR